jgi:hypothetical protein
MIMQYAYVGGGAFNWQALVGMNQDPVLPRALEVRNAQQEAVKRMGRDEEEAEEEVARLSGEPASVRRRRRYASGKRRGRR